ALHFRDDLADLAKNALLLSLGKADPNLSADGAAHACDDQIRPLVPLPFHRDLRDRNAQPPMKVRQCSVLGYELVPKHGWKNLEYQLRIEPDDKIRPGREHMRIGARQRMAVRDIDRDWQPLRRVGAPRSERLNAR